jgi:hypothetical protein
MATKKQNILGAKWVSQAISACKVHSKLTQEQQVYWENRACGAAAALICLRHFKKDNGVSLTELVLEGVANNAFGDKGWKHQGVADMLQSRGLKSQPQGIERELLAIKSLIDSGGLLIASVGVAYPTDGTRGGHLAVVDGYRLGGKYEDAVHVRDPAQSQEKTNWVAWARFSQSFSGRVITCNM